VINKKHPVANWVPLPPHEYRRALNKVLDFRDLDPDPNRTGVPPAAVDWFWNIELPGLMHRPEVRVFAQERVSELNAKAADLRQRIHCYVGSMQEEAEAAEQEAARINAVIQQVAP
jgi:hypothetical protein